MSSQRDAAPAPGASLDRSLSLLDAAMVVMGAIIGSGIFMNPYLVASTIGRGGAVLGLWAFGGAVALVGALAYAELGVLRPRAGGQYVYLAETIHPLAGFLYGWALLLVIQSGAMAAVAITFARYLVELVGPLLGVGAGEGALRLIALAAIAILSIVNYLGLRPGARVQNVFTITRVAVLLGLIAIALLGSQRAPLTELPAAAEPLSPTLLLAGMVPILFAYGGWQQLNYLAGEVKAPRRTVPLALLLGTGAVVVIYLLVNVGYLRVLGVAGLAASRAPASDAARAAVGEWGARFVAFGIASSTFGFLNLAILAAPRVYFAMAQDGCFFHRAARVHPRHHVPGFSILLQSAWAAILLLDGPRCLVNGVAAAAGLSFRAPPATYGKLLNYVVFADWIFFGLSVVALFVYRARGLRSDYRTPGYPLLPALFVLVAIGMVVNTILRQPDDALRGLALILTGIPVFFVWRKPWRKRVDLGG